MRSAQIKTMLLVTFVCLLAGAPAPSASPKNAPDSQGPLIVHEWGTFLSVQGSDGVTLGGMVDSDEALPPFVESRSIAAWRRSLMRVKGETPVTYFYTDRPRVVQVKVDMPEGVLTHWYPNVCRFGPSPVKPTAAPPRNGYLDWCNIALLPATAATQAGELKMETITTKRGETFTGFVIAETAKDIDVLEPRKSGIRTIARKNVAERAVSKKANAFDGLLPVGTEQTWRYVRDTDSALVRQETFNLKGEPIVQYEKFLFYRGVGTFSMPLNVQCREGQRVGLSLNLRNTSKEPLRGLFLIRVEDSKICFGRLDDLSGNATQSFEPEYRLSAALPLDEGVPQIKNAVALALVEGGLYDKEARAMVNTWERSYFRTDGLRILYLVPRERVDGVLPIHIKPEPDRLVRVMVGRVEVLTPARERQIEKFVADLGASDFKTRQAASSGLAKLGRLGEPPLRRVLASASDPEVRVRAELIIARVAAGK
jgi:hypothetical protein